MSPARGMNPLADETYDELLAELADTSFVTLNADLRRVLRSHYASQGSPQAGQRPDKRTARHLAALNAVRAN